MKREKKEKKDTTHGCEYRGWYKLFMAIDFVRWSCRMTCKVHNILWNRYSSLSTEWKQNVVANRKMVSKSLFSMFLSWALRKLNIPMLRITQSIWRGFSMLSKQQHRKCKVYRHSRQPCVLCMDVVLFYMLHMDYTNRHISCEAHHDDKVRMKHGRSKDLNEI